MENDMSEPKIWSQKYVKSTRVVVLFAWNLIFDQAKFWRALGYVLECEATFGAHNRASAQKNRAPAQIKLFLVLKCVINQSLDCKLGLQIWAWKGMYFMI